MRSTLARQLPEIWYGQRPLPTGLASLSKLFGAAVWVRRLAYRHGWLSSVQLPVPVIVVGNLTVGGSGKTPLVAALAQMLRATGWNPGILCRGYRGARTGAALVPRVAEASAFAGDEAVVLVRRSGCPVAVGRRRAEAGRVLLAAHPDCDLLITDDGLQHYALARDIEIVVIDGEREFGNGRLLPAGPLREPIERLANADFIVRHGGSPRTGELAMRLSGSQAENLQTGARRALSEFAGQRCYAVAGIGYPARFFRLLQAYGIVLEMRSFPDHHAFCAHHMIFSQPWPVLMTEKDAVKCERFAQPLWWSVPVEAEVWPDLARRVVQKLQQSKEQIHAS